MKRVLAIVLCLAMLMSYAVPTAYAAGNTTGGSDNIYIGDGTTINNFTNDTQGETSSPMVENLPKEEVLPKCDCGDVDADMVSHSDSCILKQYYMGICDREALEIYNQWANFPEDAQSYILQYLSWNDQQKQAELQSMLNTDLSGKAATEVDGAVINVSNIPAGGSVSVAPLMQNRSSGTSGAAAAIEALLEARGESNTQLFMWDISIQDADGIDWQPYGKPVSVEVSIPGVKLHPYTKVFVVHVGDDGEANSLSATVTEDGGIAFQTTSFSTFAGFTVDFEYEGAQFSIGGLSTILLSELFEELKVPQYVSDVANVTFTDTSLVTVEEQIDGDWLLTSLRAFNTTEALTITMDDGAVYTIKVTDATAYPLVNGAVDVDSNGTISWYLTKNGTKKITVVRKTTAGYRMT